MKPEGSLSLEDVLAESARLGLELSERTFRYYSVLGLMPRPLKRPAGTGDARVHYYPPEIIQRLLDVRSLQNQGYSLKQIKEYFELGQSVPAPAPAPAAAPSALELPALLRGLSGGKPREAARRFLSTATLEVSAEAFLDVALSYYTELLSSFGEFPETAVRQAVAEMSPLEVERLLHPLRQWRDREVRRRREARPLPVAAQLRDLVARSLAGADCLSEAEGYAAAIDALAKTVKPHGDGLPRQAAGWLQQALSELAAVARRIAAGGEPQAVLSELEGAERRVAELSRLLESYRVLLEA